LLVCGVGAYFDAGCGNSDDSSEASPAGDAGTTASGDSGGGGGGGGGDAAATSGDGSTTTSGDSGGTSTSCQVVTAPKSTCAAGKVSYGVPVSLPWPVNPMMTENTFNVDGFTAHDMNNDGKVDIIAQEDAGGVDVYLSKGDGTFAAPVHYNTDLEGNDTIVAGDFDGDCIADVLATNAGNVLSFFKGKGDGTLAPETQIAGPGTGLSMLARDLNADGKLDWVIQGGTAIIGLNKGDGTFAQANQAWNVSGDTDEFDLGDLDGNGSPDLAFAQVVVDGTGSACFLPNAGNGTFGAAKCATVSPNNNPSKPAVADLDGDGKQDLVVTLDQQNMVSVFLGNGDGTFKTRADYALVGYQAMRVADVNNDGKPDIAAYSAQNSEINVLVNNGDGTFPATSTTIPGGGPSADADEPMAVGDFLGNGLPGFAVNNRTVGSIDVVIATCKP
jgi:hypothetical protein